MQKLCEWVLALVQYSKNEYNFVVVHNNRDASCWASGRHFSYQKHKENPSKRCSLKHHFAIIRDTDV